ncbi:MAG: hypothetical protein Kow0056_13200 [Coriobacteriia bacterium]
MRMKRETTTEAPTVAEAIDAALDELGVQQDVVDYEVLHDPDKGLFGRGADKPAKVRVWIKDAFAVEIEKARSLAREMLGGEDASELDADGTSTEGSGGGDEDVVVSSDPGDAEGASEGRDSEVFGAEQPTAPEAHGTAGPRELREMTDEDLDALADAGIAVVQQILDDLGLQADIEEYEGDEGEIILDVVGDEMGILIGRHGKTLEALQTVVSTLVRRRLGWYYPLVIDVEGYRSRRREKLEDIARSAAERAVAQHRQVRLRPMTAFERKVVHVALRDDKRVTTKSEGDEPDRAVVVIPR